jgi:hypothetical protein
MHNDVIIWSKADKYWRSFGRVDYTHFVHCGQSGGALSPYIFISEADLINVDITNESFQIFFSREGMNYYIAHWKIITCEN